MGSQAAQITPPSTPYLQVNPKGYASSALITTSNNRSDNLVRTYHEYPLAMGAAQESAYDELKNTILNANNDGFITGQELSQVRKAQDKLKLAIEKSDPS